MCRSRRDSRAQMDRWPCAVYISGQLSFSPNSKGELGEVRGLCMQYVSTTDIHFKVGFFFLSSTLLVIDADFLSLITSPVVGQEGVGGEGKKGNRGRRRFH